jgi:hypothetical protein
MNKAVGIAWTEETRLNRKLYDEELYKFYSCPNITSLIKSACVCAQERTELASSGWDQSCNSRSWWKEEENSKENE